MGKKNNGRSGRRPLRGETLITTAQTELGKMANLSPKEKGNRINVTNLAKRLKISRQAIYDNGLDKEIDGYAELQRTNDKIKTEAAALRRPLEVRLEECEEKIKSLLKKLDGWIERWVGVEHNARMLGYDADLLFAPVQPPMRKTLVFKRGRKKKQ